MNTVESGLAAPLSGVPSPVFSAPRASPASSPLPAAQSAPPSARREAPPLRPDVPSQFTGPASPAWAASLSAVPAGPAPSRGGKAASGLRAACAFVVCVWSFEGARLLASLEASIQSAPSIPIVSQTMGLGPRRGQPSHR